MVSVISTIHWGYVGEDNILSISGRSRGGEYREVGRIASAGRSGGSVRHTYGTQCEGRRRDTGVPLENWYCNMEVILKE